MTTLVEVLDENCKLKTIIKVTKTTDETMNIEIQSDCEVIRNLAEAIGSKLKKSDAIMPFEDNVIYKKAKESMGGCVPCTVPCAIIKAIWAESGMALKKGARIQFSE
ncbi:MAG: hypothetical protein QXQ64_05875 [Candidatus Bathyarchaeia archaeon]